MGDIDERKKRRKRHGLALIWAICIPLMPSLFLGAIDMGASVITGHPLYCKMVESYLDGGSTLYSGFGYNILCLRKVSGARGPVIRFRLVPVSFCLTTKHVGFHLCRDDHAP
jgi:hypothetical protein